MMERSTCHYYALRYLQNESSSTKQTHDWYILTILEHGAVFNGELVDIVQRHSRDLEILELHELDLDIVVVIAMNT